MRCDGGSIWKLSDCECFNPHTYMRCDRMPSFRWHLHICFNPHTYMRCDPRFFISLLMSRSFNPHTYMRCDRAGNSLTTWLTVSIHTPTWGVTKKELMEQAWQYVSIHTPTWGVTRRLRATDRVNVKFQSTHLHEVWQKRYTWINMHNSFNPHTYMRCDWATSSRRWIQKVSIHTPTWGVTESATDVNYHTASFNPHTYMRCDPVCTDERFRYVVSIHTPTWGVTAMRRWSWW